MHTHVSCIVLDLIGFFSGTGTLYSKQWDFFERLFFRIVMVELETFYFGEIVKAICAIMDNLTLFVD